MSSQLAFTFNGEEYKIDEILAYKLDSIVYNLKDDWDSVLLITGDRMVRVGKSVLGMVVCAYLSWAIANFVRNKKVMNKNAYSIDHIYFDNKVMIKESQTLDKYSVVQYDEGREGLAASKSMSQVQQDLIDFFNECGQLNHIFVVVCPDFFVLKEDVAIARSEYLINVFRREKKIEVDMYKDGKKRPIIRWDRGHFEMYNRKQKDMLYQFAKNTRRKTYAHIKPFHSGSFSHQYPINEEEYRVKKADSLKRFDERHKKEKLKPQNHDLRNRMIIKWKKEGMTGTKIVDKLEEFGTQISDKSVNEIYRNYLAEEQKVKDNELLEREGQKPLDKSVLNAEGDNFINIPHESGKNVGGNSAT